MSKSPAYLTLALIFLFSAAGMTASADQTGKELFEIKCASCHPNGGNIINPKKTLSKKDREANGVTTVEAIVGRMRSPGPGMVQFTKSLLSDEDAKKIAEYEISTFNK